MLIQHTHTCTADDIATLNTSNNCVVFCDVVVRLQSSAMHPPTTRYQGDGGALMSTLSFAGSSNDILNVFPKEGIC